MTSVKRITVDELVKEITVRQFLLLDFLVSNGKPKEPLHTSKIYDALATNNPRKQSKIAEAINSLYMHGFIDGRWATLGNANSIEIRILDKGLKALETIYSDDERKKTLLIQSVHLLTDLEM